MAQRKKKGAKRTQPKQSKKSLYTIGALAAIGLAAVSALYLMSRLPDEKPVVVEELSGPVGPGQTAFREYCAECHGQNAAGTAKGPPLVHRYYNPSHHADFAFVRAVRFGVRQHHWRFGNMPPQPEVSDEETKAIIEYVRELQRANGIF